MLLVLLPFLPVLLLLLLLLLQPVVTLMALRRRLCPTLLIPVIHTQRARVVWMHTGATSGLCLVFPIRHW